MAKKTYSKRLADACRRIGRSVRSIVRADRIVDVYFISGMCYNCKVFDKLKLPRGFRKQYLEWHTPREDEALSEYAHRLAEGIDASAPYVLVGYSFGAVVMQEMSLFLQPCKTVIISSFKAEGEIPRLFQAVKRAHLMELVPKKLFSETEFITEAFNRFMFHATNDEMSEYMTVTDPVYIQWAVGQITGWVPNNRCQNLYHIHGTEDQIFPYKQIRNVYPVEGGDHLMVFKMADTVSAILDAILLRKEN